MTSPAGSIKYIEAKLLLKLRFPRILPNESQPKEVEVLRAAILSKSSLMKCFLNYIGAGAFSGAISFENLSVIELLMEALYGTEVSKYLQRCCTYFSHDEDGMVTADIHRSLAARSSADSLLHQIVRRAAISGSPRYESESRDYFGLDLIYRDQELLSEWVPQYPEYLPVLIGFSTAHGCHRAAAAIAMHPYTILDQYELGVLTKPVKLAMAGLQPGPLSPERRLQAILSGSLEDSIWILFQMIPEKLSDVGIQVLQQIAEAIDHPSAMDARRALAKSAGRIPSALAWVRNHLDYPANSRGWLLILAQEVTDFQITWDVIQQMLEQPDPSMDLSLIKGLERLCTGDWKLPVEQALPLLLNALDHPALIEQPWRIWQILAVEYGHTPEAQKYLLPALRAEPPGSSPYGFLQAFLALVRDRHYADEALDLLLPRVLKGEGAFGYCFDAVLACGTPKAQDLLKKAAIGSEDMEFRSKALVALTNGWGETPEVKALLLEISKSEGLTSPIGVTSTFLLAALNLHNPEIKTHLEALIQVDVRPNSYEQKLRDYLHDQDIESGTRSEEHRQRLLETIEAPVTSNEYQSQVSALCCLVLLYGDQDSTRQAIIDLLPLTALKTRTPPNEYEESYHARNFRELCLNTLALRWPDEPSVQRILKAFIDHPWPAVQMDAAKLLSRLFPKDPETAALLAPRIGDNSVIFSEYLALSLGKLPVMWEALEILRRQPVTGHLAQDGPFYLIHYFGPRKDLLAELKALMQETSNQELQAGILRALEIYLPA